LENRRFLHDHFAKVCLDGAKNRLTGSCYSVLTPICGIFNSFCHTYFAPHSFRSS
jgi:hypothetical protein